jgi:hypothetical protein
MNKIMSKNINIETGSAPDNADIGKPLIEQINESEIYREDRSSILTELARAELLYYNSLPKDAQKRGFFYVRRIAKLAEAAGKRWFAIHEPSLRRECGYVGGWSNDGNASCYGLLGKFRRDKIIRSTPYIRGSKRVHQWLEGGAQ